MKSALKLIAASLVGLIVLLVGLQMFAAENGEVVVITTRDLHGGEHHTSVWIVDSDGHQWLRSGSATSGWYTRLSRRRRWIWAQRRARAVQHRSGAVAVQINRLMHEKLAGQIPTSEFAPTMSRCRYGWPPPD
jgi:hypothetical protein